MGERFTCLCPNALRLLAQRSVSSANGSFVLLNFKSLRATGWLKNAKIASITTGNLVLFEIYIRKLII